MTPEANPSGGFYNDFGENFMTASMMYNLTSSDGTSPKFDLGDEIDVGGSRYGYYIANGALAQYGLVMIETDFDAVVGLTATSGARPTQCAIPQFAVADNEYFWAPIGPFRLKPDGTAFQVKAAASCADSVKLYTTGVDGVVDDAATDLVAGLFLTETITTAAAADCMAVCRLVTNCQD